MKVLFVTTNYPTKAFPIYGIFVKEQKESLEKLGIQCDVFFSNGKENGGFKEHLKSIWRLRLFLWKNHYDVIHCHHVISAWILILSGASWFNKCILSYQNDPIYEFGLFTFKIMQLFIDRIIVKNTARLEIKNKVIYIPNGVKADIFNQMDKSECRKILNWDISKIYIITVNSNKGVRTQKRFDRFVDTIEILKNKYGYCNIVGFEMSNIAREKVPIYFNACDIHLLTSDFEGSPNSVKECISCNTPVVATDVGNVREMMGDIDGCYISSTFSPEDLAKGVDAVLNRNEPFNGREQLLAKGYGIDNVAQKILNIYNSII